MMAPADFLFDIRLIIIPDIFYRCWHSIDGNPFDYSGLNKDFELLIIKRDI
jgi:hypothetical protein